MIDSLRSKPVRRCIELFGGGSSCTSSADKLLEQLLLRYVEVVLEVLLRTQGSVRLE